MKKVWLRGPTTSKLKLAYQKLFGKQHLINRYHKFVQKYNKKQTVQCGALEFRPAEFKYERKWIEEVVDAPFENITVSISKYYDDWLKRQYGDYMTIPKNKNGSVHGGVFFDTEKSYKEYENQLEEICKKLEEEK